MKLLAVDSTTEACSVAYIDTTIGQEIVEIYELAPRAHSQRLLPMVDQVLADCGSSISQLDTIAFGRGPGSFTGLRICLGMVQGLAFGADIPVVAISSLQALAQTALDNNLLGDCEAVISSIDARMDELYWAGYTQQNGLMQPLCDEHLSAPEAFKPPVAGSRFAAVGSGWQYRSRMTTDNIVIIDDQLLPRASAIAKLAIPAFEQGQVCLADQAQPTYIRDQVAWKKINEQ